jgi:hypothetical protein
MNKISVRGKLVRDIYVGQGKSGTYVAAKFEIPDGNFHFWIDVYAPGAAGKAFTGAAVGDCFQIDGSLTEKKKPDGTRVVQIKAEKVTKPGQAAPPANTGITDEDIPY